jgi:N-acyl amino acid synthase of PEP-CTERM/exosortase system
MTTSISENFNKYFEIMLAADEQSIRAAHALRYQVYCVETSFEDPSEHPDNLEIDYFDSRATHSVIIYLPKASHPQDPGSTIATVRLILPKKQGLEGDFPIERYCSIDPKIRQHIETRYDRSEVAEVSRFCVSRTFRSRFKEAETIHGIVEPPPTVDVENERRAIPHISLGLVQAAVSMSQLESVRVWYAVMEPQLVRRLRRFGLYFTQVGEQVQYHGLRVPCMLILDETLEKMKKDCPEIWDFVTKEGSLWPY